MRFEVQPLQDAFSYLMCKSSHSARHQMLNSTTLGEPGANSPLLGGDPNLHQHALWYSTRGMDLATWAMAWAKPLSASAPRPLATPTKI